MELYVDSGNQCPSPHIAHQKPPKNTIKQSAKEEFFEKKEEQKERSGSSESQASNSNKQDLYSEKNIPDESFIRL